MKIKLDLPPYFCPECGQFRTAQQTERHYDTTYTDGYGSTEKPVGSIDGLVRTCIQCRAKVHNTEDLVEHIMRKNIANLYGGRNDSSTLFSDDTV